LKLELAFKQAESLYAISLIYSSFVQHWLDSTPRQTQFDFDIFYCTFHDNLFISDAFDPRHKICFKMKYGERQHWSWKWVKKRGMFRSVNHKKPFDSTRIESEKKLIKNIWMRIKRFPFARSRRCSVAVCLAWCSAKKCRKNVSSISSYHHESSRLWFNGRGPKTFWLVS
jgi:hypothetical protein